MSTTNLAPLKLVISSSSGSRGQGSMKLRSQNSNGSNSQASDISSGLRLRPRTGSWYPAPETVQQEDDPDDLYLGDIYAQINRPFDCFLSTQAEQEEVAGRYHAHIRRISNGWQHLRYLADFMTVSTVPLRCRNLTAEDRYERLNQVKISVVEYGAEVTSKELNSPRELDEFMNDLSTSNMTPEGRLIIVQDLSTHVIEKLGSTFDIEPGFFRSHIGDYVWLNTRDPQAEIPLLEALSTKSSYFNIQYVQPRYFKNKVSLERAKLQAESFNVLRRIDHDGRFKPWSDMPESDVGLVRSKVSLWVRPNRSDKKGWLGVLLVDPTITEGFPLWAGYGNFHPPPSINATDEEVSCPPYGNSVQQFIYWTLNQTRSPEATPPPSPDLLPSTFFTMICAQWIIMCEYVNTRLGQIEWEIEHGLATLYAQDFDHTLQALLTWRRRVPIYHEFIERSISRISARHTPKSISGSFDSWDDVLTNLRDISHRMQVLHCRADKIMAVSMAVTAREESKKATQESHIITRISYLAFIFVPLSFWTSFFSMSGDFPIRTYWIYATIALPISAVALGALIFAERIGCWWRQMRENRKLGRRGKGRKKWSGGV